MSQAAAVRRIVSWWHRVDDNDSDGRPQGFAQPLARQSLSRRISQHGTHPPNASLQRFGITREALPGRIPAAQRHQKAAGGVNPSRQVRHDELVPVPGASFTTTQMDRSPSGKRSFLRQNGQIGPSAPIHFCSPEAAAAALASLKPALSTGEVVVTSGKLFGRCPMAPEPPW